MRRFCSNKIIWIIIAVLLIVGYLFWFLIERDQENINNILSEKVNEFMEYGNSYTIDKAKKDGFYVEETIQEGAPVEMIRFIEFVWHKKDVDLSIAKIKDKIVLLSYLIYSDNIIYVLDYNTQDETYTISEYKYLTYDYDTENGIQTRYLTNDKELYGKDKLTDEQKKNCYYLCAY